ncbi:unnamed protein product [Polarella glacialis]|uniref:BTB domain-containing protein n=1 Tax=Polarella glacialis TaxID=89957 RepID=A0A813DCX0_POLGL|nr:unnamed protein product [Polarella glacialis]CAE8728422.1 unnamed protein product [Polarella glacialis]
MLSSGMSEDRKRSLEVKDSAGEAVKLFLELVYTGTTSREFGHDSALSALDLAHRWQVQCVVTMLELALKEMVSDENFASIAAAAKLKGLHVLSSACRDFGASSSVVQKQLKARKLPGLVLELMGVKDAPAQGAAERDAGPSRKRRAM